MSYRVQVTPEVERQLGLAPAVIRERVRFHLDTVVGVAEEDSGTFALTPEQPPLMVVTLGSHQVRYEVDRENKIVTVRSLVRRVAYDDPLCTPD